MISKMSLSILDKVNVRQQCIFAFIPLLNIWAFSRIKKIRKWLLLSLALVGLSLVVNLFVPFPFSVVIDWAISIPVTIHYMRKWSIQWNDILED
jgi:hypothetical protein